MIKSKINTSSFLIVYFLTFMMTIVFPAIIYDIVKKINSQFDIFNAFKIVIFLIFLISIWRYFYFIHTKIEITQNQIIFKKFFKTSKYNWSEINFYFEKSEFTNYEKIQSIYLVRNEKIIERISEFEYSNFETLKKNMNLKNKKIKVGLFKILKFQIGLETKI